MNSYTNAATLISVCYDAVGITLQNGGKIWKDEPRNKLKIERMRSNGGRGGGG